MEQIPGISQQDIDYYHEAVNLVTFDWINPSDYLDHVSGSALSIIPITLIGDNNSFSLV